MAGVAHDELVDLGLVLPDALDEVPVEAFGLGQGLFGLDLALVRGRFGSLALELLEGRVVVRAVAEGLLQLLQGLAGGEEEAVENLESALAGAVARGVAAFAHYSCSKTRMVSSMAEAASTPLLPALTPARSMACSRLSQVSRPKPMGVPEASSTWATPLAHSLQT